MAKIACLGWGSLIWDPRQLPLKGDWEEDGPQVRVEFLRKSDAKKTTNGRMTLVLHRSATPVPSMWAIIDRDNLPAAIKALANREGTPEASIHYWDKGRSPRFITALPAWARAKKIDAVIWTGLGPDTQKRKRTAQQVVKYLEGLKGSERVEAEKYVRLAPPQIATAYRKQIEAALKWTPQTLEQWKKERP